VSQLDGQASQALFSVSKTYASSQVIQVSPSVEQVLQLPVVHSVQISKSSSASTEDKKPVLHLKQLAASLQMSQPAEQGEQRPAATTYPEAQAVHTPAAVGQVLQLASVQ